MITEVLKHSPILGLEKHFDEAQRNRGYHPRGISFMYQIYKGSNLKDFTVEFNQWLTLFLIQNEKAPQPAKKGLEFAAKFCCHQAESFDEEEFNPFLNDVIDYITIIGKRKETVVRQRVCEFITFLLDSKTMIEDILFEKIRDCLLERLKDKLASVRALAVPALQKLQDPMDPECPVISAYLFHVECDPSVDVRKNILRSIAVNKRTMKTILERTLDVSESVRKEVYYCIRKTWMTRFSIKQRHSILINGLTDRSGIVRDYVKDEMVKEWFQSSKGNYIEMLKKVNIETLPVEHAHDILFSLFQKQPSSELIDLIKGFMDMNNLIEVDMISPELILLWKEVVDYFISPPPEVTINKESVERIMPMLTKLARYIKVLADDMENGDKVVEYIILRLIDLARLYSFDDEMGRSEMISMCQTLLTSEKINTNELISHLAKFLLVLVPAPDDRFQIIATIVSDIRQPLDSPDSLEITSDDVIDASMNENNLENVVKDCVEENTDPNLLCKCLTLICESLRDSDVEILEPAIMSLEENFISNCFKVDHPEVMNLALRALGYICLLDIKYAQTNFVRFCLTMVSSDLCKNSIEVIFNLLLIHGVDSFSTELPGSKLPEREPEPSYSSLDVNNDETLKTPQLKYIMNFIANCLESGDSEIRMAAALGLGKLFLTNTIRSPILLGRLILLWFSDDLGREANINRPLGMFFNLFVKKIPGAGAVILETFIPTLEFLTKFFLVHYAQIDPNSVASLIITLLRHDTLPSSPEEPSWHCRLTSKVLPEVLARKTNSKISSIFLKGLSNIMLCEKDKPHTKDMLPKMEQIINCLIEYDDRGMKKVAISFYNKLLVMWGMEPRVSTNLELLASNRKSTRKSERKKPPRSNYEDDDEFIPGSYKPKSMRKCRKQIFAIEEEVESKSIASEIKKRRAADRSPTSVKSLSYSQENNSSIQDPSPVLVPGTPEASPNKRSCHQIVVPESPEDTSEVQIIVPSSPDNINGSENEFSDN